MRVQNDVLVIDADLSADSFSAPICLEHIMLLSVQINFTGTALNGSFTLQISNDEGLPNSGNDEQRAAAITHWEDSSITSAVSAVTGAGTALLERVDVPWMWARVKWDRTSGSGTVTNSRFMIKGV